MKEKEELVWNKKTKIDAAFSQVSRKTDLAFEDMGILKDAMDKRADGLLKKAWDSVLSNLKPAMAATVVARNMECWLEQLKKHVIAGTSRKDLLESFPTLLKVVKYMADASVESIRMTACWLTREKSHLAKNLVRGLCFQSKIMRNSVFRRPDVWARTRVCP